MVKLAKRIKLICDVIYWFATMAQEIANGFSALLNIYIEGKETTDHKEKEKEK